MDAVALFGDERDLFHVRLEDLQLNLFGFLSRVGQRRLILSMVLLLILLALNLDVLHSCAWRCNAEPLAVHFEDLGVSHRRAGLRRCLELLFVFCGLLPRCPLMRLYALLDHHPPCLSERTYGLQWIQLLLVQSE